MVKKELKTCSVCGLTSEEKPIRFFERANAYMCKRHGAQFEKYGKTLDTFKFGRRDKNEIIIKDNYAEIILRDVKQNISGIALVDIEDIDKCKQHKWFMHHTGYVYTNMKYNNKYKTMPMHRFLLNYDGPNEIDHINHNKLDNRKANIRIVSDAVNAQNRKASRAFYDKDTNKWRAIFSYYGTKYDLGRYNSKEEAAEASENKIKELSKNSKELAEAFEKQKGEKPTGVYFVEGKWRAVTFIKGKTKQIGTYKTKEDAIKAKEEYEKTKSA